MKIAGIVAEYNPFHNGHKYQIQATRQAGAEGIVAVMSGDCVQRGGNGRGEPGEGLVSGGDGDSGRLCGGENHH